MPSMPSTLNQIKVCFGAAVAPPLALASPNPCLPCTLTLASCQASAELSSRFHAAATLPTKVICISLQSRKMHVDIRMTCWDEKRKWNWKDLPVGFSAIRNRKQKKWSYVVYIYNIIRDINRNIWKTNICFHVYNTSPIFVKKWNMNP